MRLMLVLARFILLLGYLYTMYWPKTHSDYSILCLVMVAQQDWAGIIFCSCGYYLSSSFFLACSRNFVRRKIHFASKFCVLLYGQHYCTALEQWASAKLFGVVQRMELRNFCSSFSTEGATYIPRAAMTLGIGTHSSLT